MYCNHCGNNLPAGSRFCNSCGNRLPGGAAQRQSRGIPPPVSRPARRRLNFQEEYEDNAYLVEDDIDAIEEGYYEEEDEETAGTGDEEIIFSITPAFYQVGIKYFFAIMLSVISTAVIAYYFKSYWVAAAVAAMFFIRPIYYHILHNRTIYTLTTVKVEIETGVFSRNSRNIPLRHVQDVTVNQTLKERMLGIGDVIIDSATIDGTMPLHCINDPRRHADLILNELQYWN